MSIDLSRFVLNSLMSRENVPSQMDAFPAPAYANTGEELPDPLSKEINHLTLDKAIALI